ncbi:hypothetical protein FHR59_003847 [Xanthomonas arboricola]|uniref:hypothetical protein n=1 Tax=Xanthomonas TaxID=338 RepID=UPI000C81DACF|nr:hypothetical protein [Xanthomonas arboricola]MBB6339550.1 hypothetical protein [Xanthomonas arboricola]NIJ78372.1 hypothetical protein [Xanthomonas sp. CFBP 8151]PPU30176.1 hypothetical protein XarbCFBP7604_19830 [Xanthomonas arboricola]
MRKSLYPIVLFGLAIACGKADALQYISGQVTSIEASYMPSQIPFVLNSGNAACPAGKPVYWANPSIDNNKAIYAALVTSLTTGKKITFIIDDDDKLCKGKFLYLEN